MCAHKSSHHSHRRLEHPWWTEPPLSLEKEKVKLTICSHDKKKEKRKYIPKTFTSFKGPFGRVIWKSSSPQTTSSSEELLLELLAQLLGGASTKSTWYPPSFLLGQFPGPKSSVSNSNPLSEDENPSVVAAPSTSGNSYTGITSSLASNSLRSSEGRAVVVASAVRKLQQFSQATVCEQHCQLFFKYAQGWLN